MMRAGTLRERVEVQRASVSRDAFGAGVVTWSTVSTLWAALKPTGGGEKGEQDVNKSRARYELTMRAGATLLATDRILWRSRAYEVEAPPQADPMREFMVAGIVESPDPQADDEGAPTMPVEFVT